MPLRLSTPALTLLATLLIAGCNREQGPAEQGRAVSPGEPRLSGTLVAGPFQVGFRTQTLSLGPMESEFRGSDQGLPTTLRLYLWYPATWSSDSPEMRFSDYYRVQEEVEPDANTVLERLVTDMTSPPGIEPEDVQGVLSAQTWATQDVPAAQGQFPLVLWSYRDSIPTMQALLNEYLASHGFVVAFAWPTDHAPPLPWQTDADTLTKRESLAIQVDLLDQAYGFLQEQSFVDPDRSAILAWSYGGESANALQRRRSEIDLVLGVDATIVNGWIFQDADALAAIDRAEFVSPYVLLRNGRPRLESPPSSEPPLLAEIPSGAWSVRYEQLSHGNFNFPGGMVPGILNLGEVSPWAIGGTAAREGYEAVCRHSLAFLQHYLGAAGEDGEVGEPPPLPQSDARYTVRSYPPHG